MGMKFKRPTSKRPDSRRLDAARRPAEAIHYRGNLYGLDNYAATRIRALEKAADLRADGHGSLLRRSPLPEGGMGYAIYSTRSATRRADDSHLWMQDIHAKKGALHAQLGYPQGQPIPTGPLERIRDTPIGGHVEVNGQSVKVTHLLKKRAVLALTYRGE